MSIRSLRNGIYKKGGSKKVTEKCIGKITEKDGFIPNANQSEMINSATRTHGVFEIFEQLGKDVSVRLKEIFPDIYREIKAAVLLRLVYSCTPKLIKHCFGDFYLVRGG